MPTNLIEPYSNTGSGSTLINPYLPVNKIAFDFWRKPVYQIQDGTYWTPGIEGRTFSTNEWDFIKFGGPLVVPLTPGVCSVSIRKDRAVDNKKPVGSDGGRQTFHGVIPSQFDVELEIWTPEQYRKLEQLWPILFPHAYKGKIPPAFDVTHPVFSIHKVKSAQFVGAEGPVIGPDGKGRYKMRAIEFLKPGKKSASADNVQERGGLLDAGAAPAPGGFLSNLGPK